MSSEYTKADSRNYGFWNEDEQERLQQSTVAIAGAGGDGFQLGYKLAMMGVGRIKVADPEVFEQENSNRVFGATEQNCGRNKAEVFKEMALALPRNLKVDAYSDGVTGENIDDFMQGVDLVLDESELRYLNIGTMIARTAIKNNIPNLMVMNIGFAGVATSFKPDPSAYGFEKLMGIPLEMPLDEVADMQIDYSRAIPYIPPYGDFNTFKAVIEGAPLPSISQGVDAASSLGSTEAFLHLVTSSRNQRHSPVWSPRFKYTDSYTNKSGIIRFPKASYYKGVATIVGRSMLGINPKASYSATERDNRQ